MATANNGIASKEAWSTFVLEGFAVTLMKEMMPGIDSTTRRHRIGKRSESPLCDWNRQLTGVYSWALENWKWMRRIHPRPKRSPKQWINMVDIAQRHELPQMLFIIIDLEYWSVCSYGPQEKTENSHYRNNYLGCWMLGPTLIIFFFPRRSAACALRQALEHVCF